VSAKVPETEGEDHDEEGGVEQSERFAAVVVEVTPVQSDHDHGHRRESRQIQVLRRAGCFLLPPKTLDTHTPASAGSLAFFWRAACYDEGMATYRQLHEWNVTRAEAQAIQNRLRDQVRVEPLDVQAIRMVAGADISFDRDSDTVFAGFVVLRLSRVSATNGSDPRSPTPAPLEVIERAGVKTQATFPYIPGLLSFRETPALLEAWERLAVRPDALIADGQGQAHPRRFGIACHLGLLLDLPTVGCAKSILCGTHGPVGDAPGDWMPLVDEGETVGVALRLKAGAAPVYVSVGHRCDLPSAIALVRCCAGPTRVPETTRYAHLYVNELRRQGGPPPEVRELRLDL